MPRLAALVLAAGKAERFGGGKLAALFQGQPVLAHALRIACAAPVDRVIVVGGDGVDLPNGAAQRLPIASTSLSQSLKAGLAAAGDVDGVFVFLGDMPLVPPGMAAHVLAALGDGFAALPEYRGLPGHPVLLSRAACALAGDLTGDHGIGRLLRGRDDVVRLAVEDEGVVLDIDRPADLAALEAR